MKKSKLLIVSVLLISVLSTSVFGDTVKELEDKQKEINKNIDNASNSIDQKKVKMAEIEAEVKKLDKELTTAMDELTKLNKELDKVSEELETAKSELVTAREEKEQQQETLETRIRYMYEYGEISYLDTLLSATSFTDFLNRVEYIKVIYEYDQNIYDSLEKKEQEINDLVKTIDMKKLEVEVLQKNATLKRDELQANVTQKEALVFQIENDIQLLQQQIEEEERANKNVEAMIQAEIKKQEELMKAQNKAPVTYTGGKFMWPTPSNTTVNSPFGYRIHPITGKNKLHAGVDVPVGIGTPVYAAADGTVMTSGTVQGYGTTVIIMHGSNLSSLYGHLSSTTVSVGQSVKKGDLIAYSGNTGNSTGPHLHFEVRENGVATDPMAYVQ